MSSPETRLIKSNDLTYRLLPATRPDVPAVIMLHGWSGDETVMWIMQSALPSGGLVIAVRGLYPLTQGGYSWVSQGSQSGEHSYHFSASISALEELVTRLEVEGPVERDRLVLLGFSQGAALAMASAESSIRPAGIVSLAGYLPRGELKGLMRMPIYWGHGALDEIVPAARARQDVRRLEEAGAQVAYCEAQVGHKIGVECMRDLKSWFTSHFPRSP